MPLAKNYKRVTPLGSFIFADLTPEGSHVSSHLVPGGNIFQSIHSNRCPVLYSISKFHKNSMYSSLKVFFLWCSFCFRI